MNERYVLEIPFVYVYFSKTAARVAAYETLGLSPFLSLENTRSLGRVKRCGGAEATAARARPGSEPVSTGSVSAGGG